MLNNLPFPSEYHIHWQGAGLDLDSMPSIPFL